MSEASTTIPPPPSAETAPAPAIPSTVPEAATQAATTTTTATAETSDDVQTVQAATEPEQTVPNGESVNANAEAGPSSPTKLPTPTATANDTTVPAEGSGGDIEMTDSEAPATISQSTAPAVVNGGAPPTTTTTTIEGGDVATGTDAGQEDGKGEQEEGEGEEQESGMNLSELFAAKREEEIARRDRSLAEFLVMLDGYKPLVSDKHFNPNWPESKRDGLEGNISFGIGSTALAVRHALNIPEEITEYYLQRAGFECSDPRLWVSQNGIIYTLRPKASPMSPAAVVRPAPCHQLPSKRLLSLSAQKFVSDLSRDAFHFAKLRTNGQAAGRGRPAAGVDRNRVVLTMDDLSLALGEHGVNVKKPDYSSRATFPTFT
ncbi:hypothetical protein I316_05817 [Kwoniella heveanensis BCC8398]|uniref:Uncharacterized protein n=1 Tax=Kwoniella heveanensis BCC8398 TaxID=1296120 RepID=A0A1B9GMW6_9TREE|nr:hypothetical protein I316_05817 [Kwoniella heveanensis BCC8398]